jgi:hypothetical protein
VLEGKRPIGETIVTVGARLNVTQDKGWTHPENYSDCRAAVDVEWAGGCSIFQNAIPSFAWRDIKWESVANKCRDAASHRSVP